jgi:MFS family permease
VAVRCGGAAFPVCPALAGDGGGRARSLRDADGIPGTVLISVAVGTVAVLPGFLTGAVGLQIRRDLDLGISAIGLAAGTFFLTAAIGSGAAGALAQRIGAASAMQVATLISAASLAAVALVAGSLASLLGALAVGGLATALAQPATNLYIAEHVPEHRRGIVLGVKQAAIPAAVLLSGLSVPLVALTVGWRWTYGIGALSALVVAVLLRAARRRPTGMVGAAAVERRSRSSLRTLALVAVLATAGPNALGAYLVTTAVAAGVTEGSAGVLLAAGSALCIGVRILAGSIADRLASRTLTPVSFMLGGGAVGFGLLAVSAPLPTLAGAVLAFGLGWGWPGLLNLSVVSRHIEAPAAASGITQSGVYAGAAAGPVAFGLLASALSLAAAWVATAAVALTAAALAARVERRYRLLDVE